MPVNFDLSFAGKCLQQPRLHKHFCCNQVCKELKSLGRLGLNCVQILGHKRSFSNSRFLDSDCKK